MNKLTILVTDFPLRAAAILIAVMLVAQVIIVALRYVFSIGWPWALDLLVFCFFFIGLIPAIAVLTRNAAVRVDVFYSNWTRSRRHLIDRIALITLFFPAMAYSGWSMWGSVVKSWQVLESSPTIGGLPGYFILKTVLFLYFAGLAIASLVLAVRNAPYEFGVDQ